jgi:outer membrane receptor protein involved in Fe transport
MQKLPLHVAALALLLAGPAVAQTTGTITGIVTDGSTQRPVVGALVVATSPALPAGQSAVSDAQGGFTLGNLPPGSYRLAVSAERYKPTERAELTLGENVTLRANLAVVPEAVVLEEVVVTGSRIRRKDLTTPAPVTMVSRDQIQSSGKLTIGELLQSLPEQGNAANIQVNNGGATVNTDGATRINLRNLGVARTLVLVNGRRFVAGGLGADASVDLNSIPTSAVQGVEVLKDGASAVYGSDAIGGVVNVLTRKAFNGTEATLLGGTSGHGDAQTTGVDVTTGRSSAEGNLLFAVGYSQQWSSWLRNRSWSKNALTWDYPSGKATAGGSYAVPQGDVGLPANAASDPNCIANPLCNALANSGADLANDVFIRDPSTALGWRIMTGADTYNFAGQNYLTTPSTRVQAYSSGDTRLGTAARGFYEMSYVQRSSRQNAAPMPLYPSDYGISVSKDSVYNPFGVDLPFVGRRLVEFGRRDYSQDLTTFRVVTGLDGTLPDSFGPLHAWSWDVNLNYGRTAGSYTTANALRNSRVADAVGPSFWNDPADHGKGASCGTVSAPIAQCVPINLFGGVGSIQPQQIDNLGYTGTTRALDSMVAAQVNTSGELGRLFSDRAVALAAGYEFRREIGAQIADPIAASGDSADANFKSTQGSVQTNEAYAELSIPLVAGLPGLKDLEVGLAARFVDYSTFGTHLSYKAGLRYTPVEDVTLRGTASTAFRAPSINELFLGNTDQFPIVSDPCNDLSGASADLKAQCLAHGVPNASGSGDPRNQVRAITGGNDKLRPETAQIFTMGLVLQPRVAPALSVTVDYYDVYVNHAIASTGAATILGRCYPGTGGTSDQGACDLISRDGNGRILFLTDKNLNLGWDKTAGLDLAIRYGFPAGAGRVGLLFDGTYLIRYDRKLADGTVVKGAGTFDLGSLPRVKANLSANWAQDAWGAGAALRYVGTFKECAGPDGTSDGGLCYQNNPGSRQAGVNVTADVHGSYALKSGAGQSTVMVGVNNVLDQKPQYVYSALLANSDPKIYDFVGRYYYARVQHSF